jgi:hypothetical protein
VPRRDSLFRRMASFLINKAVQRSTGVLMHDYGCMLRGYRRPIVEAMLQCREHSTFIPVLANSFARHTTEMEVATTGSPRCGYSIGEPFNNLSRRGPMGLGLHGLVQWARVGMVRQTARDVRLAVGLVS